MQAIHTEMKKHETFQQNMYNRLHNELQTFIKGKSPAAFTHVPESAPVRPPVSAEPSTDDLKSMLMARLLAEGDNTEADLVHALRRNTELHTVSLANQVTKSDLQNLQNSFESKLGSIANTVKTAFEALSKRVSNLEETCQAAAGSKKRRHEDDEPDEGHPPHEGEKRQRLYLASLGSAGDTSQTHGEHIQVYQSDRSEEQRS